VKTVFTEREYNRYSIAHGDFDAALRFIHKARECKDDLIVFEALFSMAINLLLSPFFT
jgi:hypothetical protein